MRKSKNASIILCFVIFGSACSGGVFELKRERALPPSDPITRNQPGSPIPGTSMVAASFISCSDEYQQFANNADGLIEFTKELKVSGQITSQELISVDQDAGMLSARVKNACDFFINRRISFKEYREEVDRATADYKTIRQMVLQKVDKN